jgi:hypothetical protein
MISLHSCFVAGLTLVYCIWRERSLFSYDALEATRACSQILTIFGEKWPGAIKYRDIFDALSGSLFKLTIAPATATQQFNGSQPLRLDIDANPTPRNDQVRPEMTQSVMPTMSHMVTDAVKEAFMEVDEEAPGGWQGWRMWNDMVRDEVASVPDPTMRAGAIHDSQTDMTWSSYDGSAQYGIDPIQDAAMHMGLNGTMDESQWSFGGYR